MEKPPYNLEYSFALFVGENYQKKVGEVGMKIRVWARTDVVGSMTEDVIEVEDDLTEKEIDEEARAYLCNFVEWGWNEVEQDG